jgi:hypothetical protein
MNKILEQIIFKSLFEDVSKTVIKQAPRSVVDKARALKGYAFRIQSTRTGGTVDIDTLVKRVRINDQYGENSHTSDDKWVYIFGADLRDADRKFFCNVLILPVTAAIKIYGKDGVIDAQQNGLIGTAPVYQEVAMAKPTTGQKVDNAIEITKAVLSNKEPVKEPVKPGELEKKNYEFTTDSSGNVFDADGNIVKLDADGNPIKTAASGSSDFKNVELKGDEIIIKMPKDGFKYGIKNNDEFAKLQTFILDSLKTPSFTEFYNKPEIKPIADKFIGYGADGNYGVTTQALIVWLNWAVNGVPGINGKTISVDLANKFLAGQNKIKIITESLVSYKPRYMTIIESKILQEQLKLNLDKPLPTNIVTTVPVKPKEKDPKPDPKVDPKIQKMSPEQQKKVKADIEKAKKMADDALLLALAQTKKAAAEKAKKPAGESGLMRGKNGSVIPKATFNLFKATTDRKPYTLATKLFKPMVYGKSNLTVRMGIDPQWQSLQGFTSTGGGSTAAATISRAFGANGIAAVIDFFTPSTKAKWYFNKMYKGATIGKEFIIKGVHSTVYWIPGNADPQFMTWYYITSGANSAWFPTAWFEIPK